MTNQSPKAQWAWKLVASGKRIGGRVAAVDPREAISQALTSAGPSGMLVGDQHAIPTSVLDKAPGNADPSFDLDGDGFRIAVLKLSNAEGHPDLTASIRRLRCCCCGATFEGRQFWNQDTGFGLGDCCVDYVIPRVEDLERTYGICGVHYGLPVHGRAQENGQ